MSRGYIQPLNNWQPHLLPLPSCKKVNSHPGCSQERLRIGLIWSTLYPPHMFSRSSDSKMLHSNHSLNFTILQFKKKTNNNTSCTSIQNKTQQKPFWSIVKRKRNSKALNIDQNTKHSLNIYWKATPGNLKKIKSLKVLFVLCQLRQHQSKLWSILKSNNQYSLGLCIVNTYIRPFNTCSINFTICQNMKLIKYCTMIILNYSLYYLRVD